MQLLVKINAYTQKQYIHLQTKENVHQNENIFLNNNVIYTHLEYATGFLHRE